MAELLYRISADLVRRGASKQPCVELYENGRLVTRISAGTLAPMARRGRIDWPFIPDKAAHLLVTTGHLHPFTQHACRRVYEPTVDGIVWAYTMLLETRGRVGGANLLRRATFEDLVGRDLPIIDEFLHKTNLLDAHDGPVRELRAYLDELATREGIRPEHLARDGVRLTITDPACADSILAPWSVIEALANAEPDTDLRDIVNDPDLRWMLLHYGYLSRRGDGKSLRFVTPGGRMRAAWLLWRRDEDVMEAHS